MISRLHSKSPCAFSRIELLAVSGVITLLLAVVWPTLGDTRLRAQMVECLDNLRRVGQGFHQWAGDHQDRFPWESGELQYVDIVSLFTVASNEFGTPRFLVCPNDATRSRASSFAYFQSQNLSYYVGTHSRPSRPRTWLAGDRNLAGKEGQICPVTFRSGTMNVAATGIERTNVSWKSDLHAGCGNLLLSDGSVHQVSQGQLTNFVDQAAAQDPNGANCILKP